MFNSTYSTASALDANQRAHAQIASNLAHINVPGFRRHVNVFESMLTENKGAKQPPSGSLNGIDLDENATDFTSGPSRSTERPLDVAIAGDAFFEVEGPDGPLYTRNGTFHIGEDGNLVTSDGITVNGDKGAISIPGTISPGQIVIAPDGTVSAAGEEMGKLKLVTFENNNDLERAGTTFFRQGPLAVTKETEATVKQGSLEMANVSAVEELVLMLTGSRHLEASQRAMRSISDTIAQHTSTRG